MKTPNLESERIILRPLKINDAQEVFENWTNDSEVAKFMRWSVHKDISDTVEWVKTEEENVDGDNYNWGFVLKSTGKIFGSGGFHYKKEHEVYELGYNIMRDEWGKGLTTEACIPMLEFAKNVLKVKKIFCCHAVDNLGSENIINKLGFIFTGNGEYSSFDGERTFKTKDYILEF